MTSVHEMPFGAAVQPAGGVRFALWAPGITQVDLELSARAGTSGAAAAPASPSSTGTSQLTMQRDAAGWHTLVVAHAGACDHYRFRLPDGRAVPDPASRSNPDDAHAASAVVDPAAYRWRDAGWRGRPWSEAVIYELHVGTFTAAGSFAAAAGRLKDLADLGVTAIELMPLADFPGRRNWGYDGVLPFAPDASYGTPDELKALVDVAHGLGLMVLIDVVYNHFGPDGNYLHAFCPEFFNPAHATPWGAAINFDGEQSGTVREFFIHNALYWVEEFHADGLRMDAIHAIRDESPRHIVREICAALRDGPGRERAVHVVVENDANDAALLGRDGAGMPLAATAQWNDDFHHAAHVLLSGETDGYYADFAAAPIARLGRALAEGFVYQGEASPFRDGAARGQPSAALPPAAFIASLQNHDQVGNRAFGERIGMLADPALLDAAYACLLLAPHVPMLWMGEEFEASTPFSYFCDFEGELAEAVTRGRRAEFARFPAFADPLLRERIPDPNDIATFAASTLDWSERERHPHEHRLTQVRRLLALRRTHLVPRLAGAMRGGAFSVDRALLRVRWQLADGSHWRLWANFGPEPMAVDACPPDEVVHELGVERRAGQADRLARGGVRVAVEATALG
ncbi:MAG: malto-oligosyltrehalose trehalohydrolase [Caldimonas sp.]